jgi:hypothetical protein
MAMKRIVLIIAALLASVLSVYADDAGRFKWDGAITVEAETAQCGGQFATSSGVQARFHPKTDPDEPYSSFTRFNGAVETVFVQKDGAGQFNGTGFYEIYSISAGQFTGGSSNSKSYNLTQTPPNITTSPNPPPLYVTLSGALNNYADILGCTITIRGSFTRVDAED